jgi:hypothetical protein
MHIFSGSFSYISEFKIFLNIVYEVLILLSSITERGGGLKVHLGPPSGFCCLNDKMIKELMSFC